MKKVLFTSILLLSAVSFGGNIYAQGAAGGNNTKVTTPSATKPSVKFTADGNTLTISGQGDLTTWSEVSSELKFTATGRVKVGTQNNQYNNNSVGASAVYNKDNKYYAYFPKKIASIYPDYVDATSVTYSWNDNKIENLYHYDNSQSQWVKVLGTDLIDFNDTWVSGKQYSNYATSEDGSDRILLADFKAGDYFTTTLSGVTFKSNKKANLYVDANGSYVKIADDAEYDANEVYYYWDASSYDTNVVNFGEISEEQMLKLGYLEHPVETLSEKLHYYLSNNSGFSTIKFVNEGTKQPLKINNAIVNALLYSNNGATVTCNASLTTLDLSAATCEDLSKEAFANSSNARGSLVLKSLTLPLTKTTLVYSETEKVKVDKMVLPSEVLDAFRQLQSLKSVTIPEGYHRLAEKAFYNCGNVSEFNFPTSLQVIGDNAFENCGALKELNLVVGLENIGEKAFYGTSLESVKFPSSLKIINDCAFANCHIYNLKFNAGLKYIGNSAFALSNEHTEKVLEIPASVIYIGPYAFNFRQYQDVYFYGEKAPLMPLGSYKLDTSIKDLGTAFPQQTLNGNNGFDPLPKEGEEITGDDTSSGYANRENYKSHGVYLCMLHYPKGLSDENRDTYTDITRVYKTYRTADGQFIPTDTGADEATDKVGKEGKDEMLNAGLCHSFKKVTWGYADTYLGEQYIWPSHSQFNRAYCTASNSVKWDGVTPVTCDLSADEIAALKYAGYDTSKENLDELKKIAHMGTRQFVLANADVNEDKEPEKEPEYPVDIKGGEWWTICLPFNMTKAMVDETFGKDTQVCLFDRVHRHVNRTTKKNRIVLYFTQNVYKHKTLPKKADGTWNFDVTAPAPADDEIVIYAHESYMIHPTKTDKDAVFAVKNYQPVVGNPTPTVVMGTNVYTGESDTPDNVPYRYVGNYLENVDTQVASQSDTQTATQALTEVKVPKFSYVYASDGKETKFWFLTSDDMTWKPNKCVVQTNTRGDGQNDYEEFFDYTVSSAKQSSFFGEDFIDTPTSIEDEMVIIAGEGSDAPVYSLDGTLVNSTGDLTGLPKGVYIKGGKKYVVK
nr:leucine-rich repeat domain-containing protein [uncultured Prevotella sp.]